jgi:uncharacterized protein (TIGR00251 family)
LSVEVVEKVDAKQASFGTTKSRSIIFRVRVQPRASRNEVGGEWEGALKVRLTAPPVDGRANEALCRLLAECLNVPAGAVRLLSGERSRTKRVEVDGVSAEKIRALV